MWSGVLEHYCLEHPVKQMECLDGAGGFSGAQFWRLTTASSCFCLRRWPREHPSPRKLRWIHGVLAHVWDQGFRVVPRPVPSRDGQTFVEADGYLWELAPWLPGRADYHERPSATRLRAAMQALARFHAAAVTFPAKSSYGNSPGINERLRSLGALMGGGLAELRHGMGANAAVWPDLAARAGPLLDRLSLAAPAVQRRLAGVENRQWPLQPCVRDIWHDHVLFEEDRVTGIIDFGAMRTDHVAVDIARLLGSLARDAAGDWQIGLEAYAQVRPLSADELDLIKAFDESSVLMSGLSWIEWVFLQRRRFEQPAVILARVDENLERLSNLIQRTMI